MNVYFMMTQKLLYVLKKDEFSSIEINKQSEDY